MKVLDLFSGIGGFSLGLERAGMETIAFCEIEPYCRQVLKKHWPDIPIHKDIKELDGKQYRGTVELVCGGYPCQPFSHAGKREGEEDDRHLWPEFFRIIRESKPAWVIAENVAGHISMGLAVVLADLENAGYRSQTFLIPACAVDAPHRRDRIWIVAYSELAGSGDNEQGSDRRRASTESTDIQQKYGETHTGNAGALCSTVPDTDKQHDDNRRLGTGEVCRQQSQSSEILGSEAVANTNSQPGGSSSRKGSGQTSSEQGNNAIRSGQDVADAGSGSSEGPGSSFSRRQEPFRWEPEPGVGRVATGIPNRVDRLKGLGNAVVPQIPEIIGRAILETA